MSYFQGRPGRGASTVTLRLCQCVTLLTCPEGTLTSPRFTTGIKLFKLQVTNLGKTRVTTLVLVAFTAAAAAASLSDSSLRGKLPGGLGNLKGSLRPGPGNFKLKSLRTRNLKSR